MRGPFSKESAKDDREQAELGNPVPAPRDKVAPVTPGQDIYDLVADPEPIPVTGFTINSDEWEPGDAK